LGATGKHALAPVVRIVSGGQTGVDRAALDWALAHGIACGGWCPHGRLAEDAPIDTRYPLRETRSPGYEERTRMNVVDSDGTLILNSGALTSGTALTVRYARAQPRPWIRVQLDECAPGDASRVREWLVDNRIRTLNIAGPRETKRPGIYGAAYAFLDALARAAPARRSAV
jgi:hypothetical protein